MPSKKSSKNSNPGVMDVSKPGKTPPDSTSKPIIVSRKPMASDPMMNDNDKPEDNPEDGSENNRISRNSPKVIQPLSTLKGSDSKSDSKEAKKVDVKNEDATTKEASKSEADDEQGAPVVGAVEADKPSEPDPDNNNDENPDKSSLSVSDDSKGHEKIEVRRVEKSKETQDTDSNESENQETEPAEQTEEPKTETNEKLEEPTESASDKSEETNEGTSKDIEEEAAEETATVNAVAAQARDRGAENKQAVEERKKQEAIQNLVESKRFFLPIKSSKKHRRSRLVALVILLVVILGGIFAALNGYLDISDLKLPGVNSSQDSEPVVTPAPVESDIAQEDMVEDNQEPGGLAEGLDSERKSDIDMIASSLEGYFMENDKYPTIGQLNNPEFRQDNLPNLDKENLLDPNGVDYIVTETTSATSYSYQTTPKDCDNQDINCALFELSATLSDGEIYTKTTE